MGVLDNILATKPLSEWQEKAIAEGAKCEECGAPVRLTAPVSDNDKMLRAVCDFCGHSFYVFEPTIIEFASLR